MWSYLAGVLAYLGFGSYVDGGSKLWGGKELNYFLIPVIVSVRVCVCVCVCVCRGDVVYECV